MCQPDMRLIWPQCEIMCHYISLQVNLNLESKASHVRKAHRTALEGSKAGANYMRKTGHAFSADNPYGKRGADDKRQMVRI